MSMKCGIAIGFAMLLAVRISAQAANLDFPLEWQVSQRNAKEWAEIRVAGTVPTNATLVEAKAELGAGLRGKATDWMVVAHSAQFKDGKFSGSLKLAAGGWYTLKGDEMLASMDGKEVVKVHNEGYPGRKNGMAYLMSSYDPNCFDNLSVTP